MKTIKSKRDFERVFIEGRRANASRVRIIYMKDDGADTGRVAFVAAKRLGNAVYRNRCKRLLREASRACGLPTDSWSVILFATRKTHDAQYDDIICDLRELMRRTGIVSVA